MFKKRKPDYKRRRTFAKKRFSLKNINPTVIVVICCVLATLVFAVILGNILGAKARDSSSGQNGQTSQQTDAPSVPKPDKQGLAVPDLFAVSVDMTGADPHESLSNQTSDSRELGNALFVPLKAQNGNMIYSSDKTASLGVSANSNLTLSRLDQHFEYYEDYVCGYFKSDFLPSDSAFDRIGTQSKEATLLAEAADYGFDEFLIEFGSAITKDDLLLYQAYLLDLKLACPDTLIGVALPKEFCESIESAALISEIMSVADFCAVDLSDLNSPDSLEQSLLSLLYLVDRYPSRIIVRYENEDTFAELKAVLDKLSISSFIAMKHLD